MDGSGEAMRNSDEMNNTDIISNIPESILSHILSLLPTKDAVRTSVLSREWEFAWTSIYNLEFSDKLLSHPSVTVPKEVFSEFVERVLVSRGNSEIQKFSLECCEEYETGLVLQWISTALMQNVQKLILRYDGKGIAIPRRLYRCPSLQELRLVMPAILGIPTRNVAGFSNLKILYLAKLELLNESPDPSSELSFTFPVLEDFTVFCCKWYNVKVINIDAPCLSKFKLRWSRYLNVDEKLERCVIKIFGGCLETFKYAGSFAEDFVLPSPSAISKAIIDHLSGFNHWCTEYAPLAASLLKKFSALNSLELPMDLVQAIHQTGALVYIRAFDKLISLKISACFSTNSEALMSFISKAPNLRVLDIEMMSLSDIEYEDDYITAPPPRCVTSCLEKLVVTYYGISVGLHIMEYVTRNAAALQVAQLVRMCSDQLPEPVRTQIWMQLLALPKISSHASVEFIEKILP